MNTHAPTEDVADAISSLLLCAPHQKLHHEQIEARLSPAGRAYMREALHLLEAEGSVESLDDIYYALVHGDTADPLHASTDSILDSPLTKFTHAIYRGLNGCRKCHEHAGTIERYILSNGKEQARWRCSRCGDIGTFGSLPVAYVKSLGRDVSDLPICRDRSQEERSYDSCIVCGTTPAEHHHWVPSSIFPDWAWSIEITVPLCITHHREWHTRMRQHGLRWPGEL